MSVRPPLDKQRRRERERKREKGRREEGRGGKERQEEKRILNLLASFANICVVGRSFNGFSSSSLNSFRSNVLKFKKKKKYY